MRRHAVFSCIVIIAQERIDLSAVKKDIRQQWQTVCQFRRNVELYLSNG